MFHSMRRLGDVKRTRCGRVFSAAAVSALLALVGCAAPAPETPSVSKPSGTEDIDPARRYHALARQHAKNGNYEQAEIQYKKGLAMDPVSIGMMRELADVYMKMAGREKETIKTLGGSPDTSQVVAAYYDKAVAVYDEAVSLEPDNPEIKEGRAWVLAASQRYDEAIEEYQKVLTLKADDASVYVNLGYTYQRKGDPASVDAAVEAYSRAVGLNPNDRDTLLRTARMLYDADREPESRPWFARAHERDPSDIALGKFLGALYIRAKDYERAVPIYALLAEAEPEDWRIQLNYGVALSKVERAEEALFAFGEVMRLNPEKSEVYWETGDLLVDLERYSEAKDVVDRGLVLDPESANGWATLGRVLEKQKRYDNAIEAFKKGLAINDPRFNDYFEKQIRRQEVLKKRDEAIREAEEYGYD